MLIDRGPGAGFVQPGMDGHQLKVIEQLDSGLGRLEPKLSSHQSERGRVIGLFELDMTIAMDLDAGPGGPDARPDQRRHHRQPGAAAAIAGQGPQRAERQGRGQDPGPVAHRRA